MIITISDDDYIDFEAPAHMTEKQRNIFIESLGKMIPRGIGVVNIEEPPVYVGEREAKMKKWEADEYYLLLMPTEDNNDLAKKMGRSEMSVRMQRGEFVSAFLVWAKRKGYKLPVSRKMVTEFLQERMQDD